MADTAAAYVARIREVAPRGPYHLVGWSAGGLIAHEMAVLLQAAGEQVGLLAVLDGYPLAGLPPVAAPSPEEVAEAVRRETAGLHLDARIRDNLAAVYLGLARAAREFTPGVFHGELLHFAAAHDRDQDRLDAELWRPHVDGPLRRHDVACGHEEMTRPQALGVIGPALSDRLRDITGTTDITDITASGQDTEGTRS
ncbi:hypothetical protein GCM10009639_31300 [Kitasatospora putterlickiae]|uniref:Thioesterase domain-containing protein n=1 Tax=Kitasatospora putterlickiae TaxID=221725 RepID=A0ABP4IU49_9ACTN